MVSYETQLIDENFAYELNYDWLSAFERNKTPPPNHYLSVLINDTYKLFVHNVN